MAARDGSLPARDEENMPRVTPRARDRIARASLDGGFLHSALPGKTQAGFGAATIAVVLIALLSYQSLEWRSRGARLVSHALEVTSRLDMLLSIFKDAETGQRGYLLTGLDGYLEPHDAAVAARDAELGRVQALLADDPQQRARLEVVARLGNEKVAELKRTIELRRAGKIDEAMAVVRSNEGRRVMDQIRAAIAEMKDAERVVFDARSRDWALATTASTAVTLVGSGLLLVLIALAAFMSSRDFRDQRIQSWLRGGQTELGTAMQGVDGVGALGERVAALLGEYLEARVGAVYFAATPGALERVGAYALPPAGGTRPGGLTHQVLAQNEVLAVGDVPEDFFPVNAGIGTGRARHLAVAPLTADGAANGVVELGFFHPIRPHDLELLRRLGEPIGLALRAAHDRRELRAALEETQRQAEALGTQQEELSVQNEELEQQSRVLQESQTRLENQQAELEQINAHLEDQTQALERQRDDLARAQGELQRASAYKSEFLANMSHELRTPLNSSLILAKLLADNRPGTLDEEQVKFAQTIYSAGNDLLSLINDILDLSKIEAGKMDVRPAEVTLVRVCDELGDVFRPVAQNKGIDLSSAVESDVPPTMFTDATRLQQVLKNLLSNALKFTDRGGVALRVHRASSGRIGFEVKDTGIGIPREQHETIFEVFRQADGTTNRKYGGTGLGLSISRDLARLLGGELTLESAPGRGSTFTLFLPERIEGASEAATPLPASTPARPRRANGAQTASRAPSASPRPSSPDSPVPEGAGAVPPGGRVILVIEDDPRFAAVLQGLARELDFQALVATSGDEGLAMAERYRPSAIVLDVGLPDRSGLSVLDALKHRSTTRHIPVHMVSVSDYTQTALEMGATGYAIKPVKQEELVDALKRLETKFTQRVRRILVVEDDAVARESICRLLGGPDVEMVAAGTATEALGQLTSATFDCMVLDLSLPDRNGLELLEEMSKTERYAFPPVIVYTGRSLSRGEEEKLRRLSRSIIIKGARSPERLLDEVTLFLHQVESELPPDHQRMLRDARHREAVLEGKRVLVVEDDVRSIFALSAILEPKGAKVEIARNGHEALEHLRVRPGVDLVLMDVMMPEMDGLEATRRIRARPELAKLPVIALTAKAMSDDREQCLAAGANDYIAKPLDVDKLLSLVRVWMPK
jgi:signal transduction histidine kinase/DNA-binding response OmpR family regulator/CHASE3 domain sensor protein